MVAASVLPSPVFISAILPSCSAMPPMICTSKGRIPKVLLEVSRTTANASGRMSSRVSPFARTNYLIGLLFSSRLYEPVVSVTATVYHIYVAGIGAGKDAEVVVQKLHLEDRLLRAHRLHLELLGAHDLRLDLLLGHGVLRLGNVVLELAVPAVDLASPVA